VSFLAWTDQLPVGWEAKPLRSTVDYVVSNVDKVPAEHEAPVRLCNYTDVYNNEFITLALDFMQATASEEEIAKFGLCIDDVAITKDSESWDDIGVPALVRETASDLVCGYHLALLRPHKQKMDGAFLFRCLQAKSVRVQLELAANGVTRFGIPKSEIGAITLPVPPLAQQRAIADYLDCETARLDALVAAKERVLGLLAEKRRALITRAVTRGLDNGAPLKDTGVEWLPQVPRHWRASKIGRLFKQAKRLGFSELMVLSVYREYGVIERASRDDNANRVPEDLGKYQLVEVSDLVINKMKAWQGSLGVSELRGITSPDYVVFRPLHREHPRFLHFLLRNQLLTTVYLSMSNGIRTSQWRLEPDRFLNLGVLLPPLDEQRAIVAHIDAEAAKLAALGIATDRTIALLRERRAALIAAAVTGQIVIRGAVA
jgi:type I restriction enzyme S subunit